MGQTLRSGSPASPCHPQRGPSWCPGRVCVPAVSRLGLPGRAQPSPGEEALQMAAVGTCIRVSGDPFWGLTTTSDPPIP